jgi:hypothetical protein
MRAVLSPPHGNSDENGGTGWRRLIGGSRRERLVTAGTAVVIVIAIVAVIVLATVGSDGGGTGASNRGDAQAYQKQAERLCLLSKRSIAQLATRASRSRDGRHPPLALYAGAVSEIAADWRNGLMVIEPPPDRQQAVNRLVLALARLEVVGRNVARQADKGGDPSRLEARLTAYGKDAEPAVEALGLRCAKGGLGIGRLDTG